MTFWNWWHFRSGLDERGDIDREGGGVHGHWLCVLQESYSRLHVSSFLQSANQLSVSLFSSFFHSTLLPKFEILSWTSLVSPIDPGPHHQFPMISKDVTVRNSTRAYMMAIDSYVLATITEVTITLL